MLLKCPEESSSLIEDYLSRSNLGLIEFRVNCTKTILDLNSIKETLTHKQIQKVANILEFYVHFLEKTKVVLMDEMKSIKKDMQ